MYQLDFLNMVCIEDASKAIHSEKKEQGIKVCQRKLNKGYSGGIPLKTPVQNLGSDQS